MNIVFLDIDGVLNTSQYAIELFKSPMYKTNRDKYGQLFCPKAVDNLEYLCHTANAKVVISSTWRMSGLEVMKQMFKDRDINIDVIDITPYKCDYLKNRGEEIQYWLDDNKVDNYVILDDDTDFLNSQMDNFVHTDYEDGFNWRCMVKALKILIKRN